ncbi:hypothetical protein, partial [Enterococcus sp. DIV1271a]|uniref:hypothetical protein n=1 Tax=Enterococcus sp. DIV1271a TaxID=2815327 RepID=UPI001A9BDDCE
KIDIQKCMIKNIINKPLIYKQVTQTVNVKRVFTCGTFDFEDYKKIFKSLWGPILNRFAGPKVVK